MHPQLLRREQSLLVLVDLQERLHAEMAQRERVETNALKLVESARLLGVPVLVTEHAVKAFGPTLASIREALKGYSPVHKTEFSCFASEGFVEALGKSGRRQLVMAGYEAHICVCQTALDAVAAGYQVHVVRDASSSRSAESAGVGIEKMSAAGVVPATTETAIFEWLVKAGTDEFRAILPILKRTR